MHQTKKGSQWHFGMKVHAGADAESSYVHTITGTAANDHDTSEPPKLLRETTNTMDNKDIVASVIVITYNHKRYVAQALDSVLMQETDFHFEVLVGDDFSTDGTREILLDYQRRFPERIRLFLRDSNVGASYNAYALIMEAKGDYLAFCEGDDFWLAKDKLQTQVSFLSREPNVIGCSHPCRIVDENGFPKKNQRLAWVKKRNRFTLNDFRGIYLPGQTATIVKRNIFKNAQEDYSCLYRINRNISDRATTLLYLSKGPFAFLPRVMSAYRQVTGAGLTNLMYRRQPNRLKLELEYTESLEECAVAWTPQRGIFDKYYKRLYASSVYEFLKSPSIDSWIQIARVGAHTGRRTIQPLTFIEGVIHRLCFR